MQVIDYTNDLPIYNIGTVVSKIKQDLQIPAERFSLLWVGGIEEEVPNNTDPEAVCIIIRDIKSIFKFRD